MQFLKAIVDRARESLDGDFDYNQSKYELGTAYADFKFGVPAETPG